MEINLNKIALFEGMEKVKEILEGLELEEIKQLTRKNGYKWRYGKRESREVIIEKIVSTIYMSVNAGKVFRHSPKHC